MRNLWIKFNKAKDKHYTWQNVGAVSCIFLCFYLVMGSSFNTYEQQECKRWISNDSIDEDWQVQQCEHHGLLDT
jgi:hypothetical protein